MRFRSIVSILLIGIFTVFVGRLDFNELIRARTSKGEKVNREDVSRRSTVLLNDQSWVEFQIPANSSNIRLMTNAALSDPETPRTTYDDPRVGHRYSVEYELLDSDRNLIDASEYHFRSRVKQFLDTETHQNVYPLFFNQTDMVATQTRVMQLAINHSETAVAIIRLKILNQDPTIREVVARVTSRVERQDYQKRYTWNRLTQNRREKVCQFCVYNYSLLSELERTNLMRWQWTTSPTIGEFESRQLYFVGNIDDEQLDWQAIPVGKLALSESLANFAIPAGPGTLRLNFTPVEEDNRRCHALVTWFGAGVNSQVQTNHEVGSADLILDVDGGIAQVCPESDMVIRAYWQSPNDQQEVEITPEPILVQAYLSDHREVEFSISHFDNQATPFRVSVRRVLDDSFFNTPLSTADPNSPDSDAFTWEMLDSSGQAIRTGQVQVSDLESTYDHLWVDGQPLPVSDPAAFYFPVPPNVEKVRLRSLNRPLLFYGSVRPANLKQVTQVPEGYEPFNQATTVYKSWFGLRPIDQPELVRNNRAYFIRSQVQLKEVDPHIAAGNYVWNRFVPEGNWIGRRMLVPIDDQQLIREQALGATYSEIPVGKSVKIQPYPNDTLETRKLIFIGDQSPGEIRIVVDGNTIFEKTILSTRGEIEFPLHRREAPRLVHVETESPVRAFINGIQTQSGKRFFKRTAQRVDDGQLDFHYRKKAPVELLSLRLFRDGSPLTRCKIKVTIQPKFALASNEIPSTSWTVLNRVYDLRPSDGERSLLIDAEGKVDQGHRCFVRLNDDLPEGEYSIQVQSLDDTSGYVLLYQTVPQLGSPTDTFASKETGDPVILPAQQPQTKAQRPLEAHQSAKESIRTEPFESLSEFKPTASQVSELDDHLKATLRASKNSAAFDFPTEPQISRVKDLFVDTLQTMEPNQDLANRWRALGWQLEWLIDHDVVVVRELEHEKRGRGVYAFRLGTDSHLAIQAPHRFFDKRTGTIARKLFSTHDIWAACWNSEHRKVFDIAHQERHYFNAFMNALAECNSQTSFVQLHGFSAEEKTGPASSANLIVSDTTQYPARHARQTTVELKSHFGKHEVKLFPLEVKSLGGTKNSQAGILRRNTQNRFLHIEMSAEFRLQLANSASNRATFYQAIAVSSAKSGEPPRR